MMRLEQKETASVGRIRIGVAVWYHMAGGYVGASALPWSLTQRTGPPLLAPPPSPTTQADEAKGRANNGSEGSG
jgi:hypothetical protein